MPAFYVFALLFLLAIQLKGQSTETYRFRELTVSDGLPDPSVSRIIQDKNGYIWLATLNGIVRYDGNRTRKYHPGKEMNPNASNRDFPYLHVSDSGNIWVGYLKDNHALFRYDVPRDSFLYFDPFAGTIYSDSSLSVRAIFEKPDERLWVATGRNGLFKIDLSDRSGDSLRYRHYCQEANKDGGLPTNFMAPGLWQDPSGGIWILTEAGLVEYHATTDDFTTYHWSEIPLENEGMMLAPDTSGEIYFANATGLFVVNPDEIYQDTVPPRIALQSFSVNGRKRPLPAQPSDELPLNNENNNLDFTVAVLHFLSSEGNRLKYFLEGFDTEWQTALPETVLAYHNLAPGKYRLLARGVSSDGTAGAVQELINMHIEPRWYATSLAYLFYLMFFLSTGYGWFWLVSGRKDQELSIPGQPASTKKQEHAFILMARKAVLENLLKHEFGPDQMATALSLSRSQLHRRLDKLAGVSTTHFINATRLVEAKKKLTDQTFTIAEIAYDCGYSDPSYFSRKFREFYGMSPTEYREQG